MLKLSAHTTQCHQNCSRIELIFLNLFRFRKTLYISKSANNNSYNCLMSVPLKTYKQTNWCQNCLKPLMYTTVFYLAGLRLSTVFCTLMQAGVQSPNISSKTKAAISVLLSYMLIHSHVPEVIITFNSIINLYEELWILYCILSINTQYLWKSWWYGEP